MDRVTPRPRMLEYGVWGTPGRAGIGADTSGTPFRHYFVNVSRVLRRKRAAIACHRSQITNLIDDDPTGFRLSPRTIAYFCARWELFHEAQSAGPSSPGSGP
jgi:LmbE family N-acetylglucosaminyl deacetylase